MDVQLVVLAIIVFLAFMVGATTGFGGAMLTLTLAAHLYQIDFLVPVIVLLNLAISAYIVIRHYSGIDRKILFRKILPLAGLGLPVGLVIFNVVKTDVLKIALGSIVICFSLYELIRVFRTEEELAKPLSPLQSAFWLFFGGVVHGMYATGGPIIVYYAGRNIPGKRGFRSTLSALWLILNAVLLVVYLFAGKFTLQIAWTGVLLLPSIALGIPIGEWLHNKLPERSFRIIVFSILVIAGASLLITI